MGDRGSLAVVGGARGTVRGSTSSPTLSLLGGFRLVVATEEVALARGEQRLVALLALRTARHQPRRRVAATLWPDRDGAQAQACLRSSLWRLRQAVDVVDERRDDGVRLSDDVVVDVRRLAASGRRRPAATTRQRIGGSGAASRAATDGAGWDGAGWDATGWDVDDLAGGLLPDWDEDWVVVERERLRQLGLHVLEARVRDLAARERFLEACDLAHATIAMDDLRESSHRALIGVHLAEGNHAEAVRHARRYRRRLRRELGLDPSPLLDDLVRRAGRSPGRVERSS